MSDIHPMIPIGAVATVLCLFMDGVPTWGEVIYSTGFLACVLAGFLALRAWDRRGGGGLPRR